MDLKKRFALSLALAAFSVAGQAAAQTFRVLGSKGDVTLDGAAIKIGGSANTGQTFKMGAGGYLGLAHKNGKTMEIKTPGTYKVAELESKVSGAESGLASKYASFVYKELTAPDSKDEKYQNRMAKTGSVERAELKQVVVAIPKKISSMDDKHLLVWKFDETIDPYAKEADVQSYEIEIKDMFGTLLVKEELGKKEQSYTVDLNDAKFKEAMGGVTVDINAVGTGAVCKQFSLLPLGNKTKKITEDAAALKAEVGDSAIGDMILANFYQSNNLMIEAKKHYESALEKSETTEFRILYNKFLEKNF